MQSAVESLRQELCKVEISTSLAPHSMHRAYAIGCRCGTLGEPALHETAPARTRDISPSLWRHVRGFSSDAQLLNCYALQPMSRKMTTNAFSEPSDLDVPGTYPTTPPSSFELNSKLLPSPANLFGNSDSYLCTHQPWSPLGS